MMLAAIGLSGLFVLAASDTGDKAVITASWLTFGTLVVTKISEILRERRHHKWEVEKERKMEESRARAEKERAELAAGLAQNTRVTEQSASELQAVKSDARTAATKAEAAATNAENAAISAEGTKTEFGNRLAELHGKIDALAKNGGNGGNHQ